MKAVDSYAQAFAAAAGGFSRGIQSDDAPASAGFVDTSPKNTTSPRSEHERAFLTPAEYARHRRANGLPGGTRQAVHEAIKTHRIALTRTGKLVNVHAADDAWQRNTRPRTRQLVRVDDSRQLVAFDCVHALARSISVLEACRDQLVHLSARLGPMLAHQRDEAPRRLDRAQS